MKYYYINAQTKNNIKIASIFFSFTAIQNIKSSAPVPIDTNTPYIPICVNSF